MSKIIESLKWVWGFCTTNAVSIPVAILAAFAAYQVASRQAERDVKLDVLHDIAGYRYLILENFRCRPMDPLLVAMNRAIVAFADDKDLVADMVGILQVRSGPGALEAVQDRLDATIVRMADSIGAPPPTRDSDGDLPGFSAQPCTDDSSNYYDDVATPVLEEGDRVTVILVAAANLSGIVRASDSSGVRLQVNDALAVIPWGRIIRVRVDPNS